MNILTASIASTSLPGLIDRAASALVNARSSAEVLEARDMTEDSKGKKPALPSPAWASK